MRDEALQKHAVQTGGASAEPIYRMVERLLASNGEVAIDLGCGHGALRPVLQRRFRRYIGVDAVRYNGYPGEAEFVEANLNGTAPLDSQIADAVIAVETIEHLENPRAFFREIARLARPGALIIVTTPNQLSLLSMGTLFVKKRFSAFQDVNYPAHIMPLLEIDLLRIAREVNFQEPRIEYSLSGRIVFTSSKYPAAISASFPRLCSDNLALVARAP